jgi:hypothetical protein
MITHTRENRRALIRKEGRTPVVQLTAKHTEFGKITRSESLPKTIYEKLKIEFILWLNSIMIMDVNLKFYVWRMQWLFQTDSWFSGHWLTLRATSRCHQSVIHDNIQFPSPYTSELFLSQAIVNKDGNMVMNIDAFMASLSNSQNMNSTFAFMKSLKKAHL